MKKQEKKNNLKQEKGQRPAGVGDKKTEGPDRPST